MSERTSASVQGLYRHYKGKQYRVIGLVKHSETLESLVLYEALYDNPLGRLWVRPEEMFFGTLTVSGEEVGRFVRVQAD